MPPRGNSRRKWALVGAGVAAVAIVASGVAIAATTASHDSTTTASSPPRPTGPLTTPTPSPAPTVPVEALSGLLADPATINAIMGSTAMAVDPKLTTTRLYIDTTDKPECGGVWANANQTVYSGSGWTAVQTQFLREPTDDEWKHSVFESAVSFPTAEAAAKFVAKEARSWPKCDGKSLSPTSPNAAPETWSVNTVANQDRMLTARLTLEGGQGWGCQHALTARNNVVIDVEACGVDIADQGVSIAKRIADGTRD